MEEIQGEPELIIQTSQGRFNSQESDGFPNGAIIELDVQRERRELVEDTLCQQKWQSKE